MSTLYRNDKTATFPDSWYTATTQAPPLRRDLRGTHEADVCVIGAGYTGLTAARTMAANGLSVIVLDAHRAGFGASGRNGGQIASGFGAPHQLIAKKLGVDTARKLWAFTQEAKADVAANAQAFGSNIQYHRGIAHGCFTDKELMAAKEEADFLAQHYNYTDIETHETASFRDIVNTESYQGGIIDRGGAHIHPLRYALALATAAEAAGATLYEASPVHHIAQGKTLSIRTSKGRVQAKHAIIATNGYINGLDRKVAARVLPLNSFMLATEPLGAKAANIIAQNIAVEDAKHSVNYYRLSEDNRLLFGGRASARIAFPDNIANMLAPRMTALFPQLENTRIDHAWGGTLGVTATGLPAVLRVAPNILSVGGFNGHGAALSGLCGKLMGEAITGHTARFDTLSTIPSAPFPGATLGRGLLGLFLTWQSLKDHLAR